MGDFPYLDWLARFYKRKAGQTRDSADYIKAVGLSNACVNRDSTEERQRLVYEIEMQWYDGEHPLTFLEHQKITARHKQLLTDLRNDVKYDLHSLTGELKDLNIENLYEEEGLSQVDAFAHNVFGMVKRSKDRIVQLFCNILESSKGFLHKSGITAPCPFAVIGLGAIGRGEVTPYSELEYAYIVESDTEMKYFRELDVEISFRISNLGETPLTAFSVKELFGMSEGATGNATGQQQVFVDSPKTIGLRVVSNDPKRRLIHTVDGMIECYKRSLASETEHQSSKLSQLFSSSDIIYSSVKGRKLHEQFLYKLLDYESRNVTPQIWSKRYGALRRFIEDSSDKLKLPIFKLDVETDFKSFATDQLVTYGIQLTSLLGTCLVPAGINLWEILQHAMQRYVFPAENYRYMNAVLGISLFLFTDADFTLESSSPVWCRDPTTKPYTIPDKLCRLFICLLLPLQKSLHSRLRAESGSAFNFFRRNITRMLADNESQLAILLIRKPFISKTDYMYVIEVLTFAKNHQCALNHLYTVLGKETVDNCKTFVNVISSNIQISMLNHPTLKYVCLCFLIFFNLQKHTQAMEYMTYLVKSGKTLYASLAEWENYAGKLSKACKYSPANIILRQLIHIVHEHLGVSQWDSLPDYLCKRLSTGTESPANVIRCCKLVVRLHEALEKNYKHMLSYSESIEHLEIALQLSRSLQEEPGYKEHLPVLTNDIGLRHRSMHNHPLSLQYFIEALNMLKSIHGEDAINQNLAGSYNCIGDAYSDLGQHTASVEYCERSLSMRKTLYGVNTNHAEIAYSYSELGGSYDAMGEYEKGLKCQSKALAMRKALYGEDANHPDIAVSYNYMANALSHAERYAKSLEYYTKALAIRKTLHGDINHEDIAVTNFNIGGVYSSMGYERKAMEAYTMALDMWKGIYGADLNRPFIASCYSAIGSEHCSMGDYTKSLEYHTMSLRIREKLHGENTNHRDIMDSYDRIGIVHCYMGQHTVSLQHLKKSLNMMNALHGDDEVHPDIAASYSIIGYIFYVMGQYKDSLSYYMKSLRMKRALYGEDRCHGGIAHIYCNLSGVHSAMGEYTNSLKYYAKCLPMQMTLYKDDTTHQKLAFTFSNIGNAYAYMGLYSKALKFHTNSLRMKKALHSDDRDHLEIARSFHNIGWLHSAIGDHELSATYHTKALDMLKRLYGEDTDHPLVKAVYSHLGTQYSKMGQYTLSLAYLNIALDTRQALYGDTDHPDIADSYSGIGEHYSDKEEYDQSLEYHTKSLNMLKVLYGENTDHPHIANGYSKLGNVYSDMGEHDKSLEYHTKSLDMKRALYGHIDHPSIANTLHDMASMYSNMAEYATSLEYYNKVLSMRKLMYGEDVDHPGIAECYRKMGRVYGDMGDPWKCRAYLNEALRMYEAVRHSISLDFK